MPAPTVSVVIVSYRTGPVLLRCLETVLMQEGLAEILLVDNGNPETIAQRMDTLAAGDARLTIIRGQGNIGFSKGCNLGAARAGGNYILLLNPDCLLSDSRTLIHMAAAMETHPEAWLASCRILDPDGGLQVVNKRARLTLPVAFSQLLRLYRLSSRFPSLNLAEDAHTTAACYVPAISGAFMLMPATRYRQIGGLDEGYFFHVEDLDLAQTIHLQGGKVLYVPSVQAIHYRSSSKVSSLFVERHKADGFARYFRKYFRGGWPAPFFALMVAGIYLRLALKAIPMTLYRAREQRRIARRTERKRRQIALLNRPVVDAVANSILAGVSPVILAGATGQVGLHILRHLLAAELPTYAIFHRQIMDYEHPHLVWVQSDLNACALRCASAPPKTLIHTPGIWLLPPQLETFAGMGVKRLIVFSSTSIMGKASSRNPYERETIRKFTEAEGALQQHCTALGMQCTILRPTMIYGCGLDRNVSSIVRFIGRFGFFPIAKPGNGLREPVHADDLAKAVMACLKNPDATSGKIYNLGGGERISYRRMVERIFSVMGRKNRTLAVPYLSQMLDVYSFVSRNRDTNGELAKRMNRDLVFDAEPARQDFGYAPRSFLSGGLADFGRQNRETQP